MNYDSSSVEVNLITAPTDSFGGELVTVVQTDNTQSSAVTSTVIEGSTGSIDMLSASTIEAIVTNGGKGDQGGQGVRGDTGPQGPQGAQGIPGVTPIKGVDYFDGQIQSIVAGTGITINNTNPAHPIVESVVVGGVSSVNTMTGDVVLDADDLDDFSTSHKFISAAQLANIHAPGSDNQDLSGLVPKTRTINGVPLTSDITIVALPDQTGATDKFLKSDGTTAAWNNLPNLANQKYDELMAGTVNGINKIFTTAVNFASILVFKNGITLHVGDDYTITGVNQITFITAPAVGSKITALYNTSSTAMISGSNSLKSDEVPSGLVNSSNAVFTTSVAYIANSLEVFINGVKQLRGVHFTETTPASGVFAMGDAPLTGDNIMVCYQFVLSVSGNADTIDGYHVNATPTANTLLPLNVDGLFPNSALGRVLLFNGSVARAVSLSQTYTNFSHLIVIYRWVDVYGTIVLDTAVATHNFPVTRMGLIGGAYKIQIGAASITLSGATISGSTSGNTYTNSLNSSSAVQFLDTVGEIQIVRVTGIK